MAEDNKPALLGTVDLKSVFLGIIVLVGTLSGFWNPFRAHTPDPADQSQWRVLSQHAQDIAVLQERTAQNNQQCLYKYERLEAEFNRFREERDRVRR